MPCPERFKTIGGAGMHGPEGIGGTGIIEMPRLSSLGSALIGLSSGKRPGWISIAHSER